MGVESIMERQNMQDFFQEHKAALMETWFDALLKNYSPEAARIFKREKDPFANPVGYNIHLGMEEVLDWFSQKEKETDIKVSLDKVVRILAIQDFTPAQAVSFLFILKEITKKRINNYFKSGDLMWKNWLDFDADVDNLMLMAMDIYTECREKLYQIKVDEANKRVYSLLRRANILVEPAESFTGSGSTDGCESCNSCDTCETDKKAIKGCKDEFTSQS